MRDHGYRVLHLPEIRITHFEGGSAEQQTSADFSILWFRQFRSLYLYYQPGQPAWIFDVIVSVGLGVRVAGYLALNLVRRQPFFRVRIRQHLACMGFMLRNFGQRGGRWPDD